MPRYSISGRGTVVGTSARGVASLFAPAAVDLHVREVGLFNTTTSSVVASVTRLTNTTGQGTGLTEAKLGGANTATAGGTGFAGHTADAGVGDEIVRAMLGAAVGAGAIWTWDDATGLFIPAGTSNGVGFLCPTGTGQLLDYYAIWDE